MHYSNEAKDFADTHETDYVVAQALFNRYKTPGKVKEVWQEPTDSQKGAIVEDVKRLLRVSGEESPLSVSWGCERIAL